MALGEERQERRAAAPLGWLAFLDKGAAAVYCQDLAGYEIGGA